jgi:hypothetical protein
LLGFGIVCLDVNNDGRLDMMTANGHIHDGRPRFPWMMPIQLLIGDRGGRLTDVSREAGPVFRPLHIARGLAQGDLDNDGRIDALVVPQNEHLIYCHNQTPGGHALTLLLEGRTSNRDAIGARVMLSAGGARQFAQRYGGGSYQSAGDPRLHFGLGSARLVEWVEITWPSGRRDRFLNLPPGGYRVREGESQAWPIPGWKHPTSIAD